MTKTRHIPFIMALVGSFIPSWASLAQAPLPWNGQVEQGWAPPPPPPPVYAPPPVQYMQPVPQYVQPNIPYVQPGVPYAQPVYPPVAAPDNQQLIDALERSDRRRLYTNSAYGNVVNCAVNGGKARFNRWEFFVPVQFSVGKGDAKTVTVRRLDKQRDSSSFWVGFSENNELEFCQSENTGQRYKRCRTHAITQAFERGYSAPLAIPDAIDGATLTCRFAAGRY